MKSILGVFLICSIGFAQTETEPNSPSKNIGLLGYQFYDGELAMFPLGESLYLQTGIFQMRTMDLLVNEIPLLFKVPVAKDFHAFFGAKLKMIRNPGFSESAYGRRPERDFGASFEAGLQYDVNDRMMLELRYSAPVIKNKGFYPKVPNIDATQMLRIGTGFKF